MLQPFVAAQVPASAPTADAGAMLIVFDASGSMRGRIGGETKLEIARRGVRDLVNDLPEGTKLGLVAYGHRRSSDCNDLELLVAPGSRDQARFIEVGKVLGRRDLRVPPRPLS